MTGVSLHGPWSFFWHGPEWSRLLAGGGGLPAMAGVCQPSTHPHGSGLALWETAADGDGQGLAVRPGQSRVVQWLAEKRGIPLSMGPGGALIQRGYWQPCGEWSEVAPVPVQALGGEDWNNPGEPQLPAVTEPAMSSSSSNSRSSSCNSSSSLAPACSWAGELWQPDGQGTGKPCGETPTRSARGCSRPCATSGC